MLKYAKVINEETKQCEVGLGTNSAFYKSIGMIEMEVNQAYDGNWYLLGYTPSQDLSELKTLKCNEINQAREQARIDEGAEYDNDLFDIDEKSQANITAIVSMLIANNVPDTYKSVYRSKTNIDHELTKVQMVELGTVIGAKVTEIYQKSWTLKEQVNNATTREEIEVIKWNM